MAFEWMMAIALLITLQVTSSHAEGGSNGECDHFVVQSIPEGLNLADPVGSRIVPTHESLIDIVNKSQRTLRIASYYWTLSAPKEFEDHPTTVPGKQLMEAIKSAVERGVNLEVLLDKSGRRDMNNPDDIATLSGLGRVKYLNMTRLFKSGVVHSKFMIADNDTLYMGSSNFDWRSYLQIKEIGVTFENCPQLAQDLDKIFRTYVLMADSAQLPDKLPDDLNTQINLKNPLQLGNERIFFTGSPPPLNGADGSTGRTDDIEGLLHVIEQARNRIDISVMNYSPRVEFAWPRKYWPRIEDALRRAAIERRVQVRLLTSKWNSTKPLEIVWYKSLNAVQSGYLRGGGIHVKQFQVPALDEFQNSIPYARVKHDKYMVTEHGLYIGTSNWTPDYFINTCGVGLVIEPNSAAVEGSATPDIIKVMQDVFERDFNSVYAQELD